MIEDRDVWHRACNGWFTMRCSWFPSFPAGGLFSSSVEHNNVMFKYAVDAVNRDSSLLAGASLAAHEEFFEYDDSFRGSRKGQFAFRSRLAATLVVFCTAVLSALLSFVYMRVSVTKWHEYGYLSA